MAPPCVVSAFDGNAGIVSFADGIRLAIKAETHNHPSAIEPFGGANTGVGGVIRDVIAAPANTDPEGAFAMCRHLRRGDSPLQPLLLLL
jgi:phosphoribosylformylglycinamidine (FGAM) synthase-like enzyme